MTCREMDWIITAHSTSSGSAAAEHIAGCERCRRLSVVLDQRMPASSLSRSRMKRIEAMMLRDLAPVARIAPERVLLTALALILLAAACIESVLLGTNGWRVLDTLQALTVFLPPTACAGVMGWSLSRLIVPGSRHTISPAWLPIGVLSSLAIVFASLFHWRREPNFVSTGLGCLGIGLACAVPAAALLWLFLLRGATLSPCLAGATAGGLARLVSLMALEVRCPNLNASTF
jgi:hypothetical protein